LSHNILQTAEDVGAGNISGFLLFIIIMYLFILTANDILLGGSGTTIRHNTQIRHITQNNTPHSNKTQHTKLRRQ
jgi:hypothetical protein